MSALSGGPHQHLSHVAYGLPTPRPPVSSLAPRRQSNVDLCRLQHGELCGTLGSLSLGLILFITRVCLQYNVTDFIKERVTRNLGLNLDTQSRRPTPPSVLSAAAQGPGLAFMIARLSGVSPSRPRWTGRARPRARRRGLHVTTRATSCCCSLVHCVIRRHLLDGIWIRRGIKWLPRSPVPGEDTSLDSAMHGTWPLVFLRCPAPAQVSTWVMPDSMAH